jgi:hypothetical protein
MNRADTPFLPDDQATSPQSRPLFDGSYETYSQLDPLYIPGDPARRLHQRKRHEGQIAIKFENKKAVVPLGNSSGKGRLQPIAASILMMILYVARLARYDLLQAVCRLACRVSKLDDDCDRRLYRLICYINFPCAFACSGVLATHWRC